MASLLRRTLAPGVIPPVIPVIPVTPPVVAGPPAAGPAAGRAPVASAPPPRPQPVDPRVGELPYARQFSIRMSPSELDELRALAAAAGETVADIVRAKLFDRPRVPGLPGRPRNEPKPQDEAKAAQDEPPPGKREAGKATRPKK